jgi:hypothetical protein
MPVVCWKCGGTGQITPPLSSSIQCPQCFGNGQLVEDAQGLQVAWGGVYLGSLTGVTTQSPTVSIEDVTGLNSPLVSFGTHTGMVRQLMSGDITPGTVTINFIGFNGLRDGMVGQRATLTVTHPSGSFVGGVSAILLKYTFNLERNAPASGSAEFQFTGV